MSDYIIPAGYGEAEHIDKKSRFIGQVQHAETEAEAMAFVEEIRKNTRTRRTTSGPTCCKAGPCVGRTTASQAAPPASRR